VRVVETAGFYFPDSVGGTEVYVKSLARELQASGIECVIAAPFLSDQPSHYVYDGVQVYRYPFPERPFRAEVQGRILPRYSEIFRDWLQEQNADIYHQHSWTLGCGLWHLEAAKRLGLKTIVSVHVPTNICIRGTLLYEGCTPCDGRIVAKRCGSCWLQSKGVPPAAAWLLAALPQNLAPLARLPWVGPALSAKGLAANHRNNLLRLFSAADRVIAVCAWLSDALLANGAPSRKIVLSRQGVDNSAMLKTLSEINKPSEVFRFGFIGRWDVVKGVHIMVNAFKRLPKDIPAELHILAVAAGAESKKYREQVRRSAEGDQRIHFLSEATNRGGLKDLLDVDALLVPSQWLETGPLVVLEAFAAGKPVIGSDLGGIKELVSHGRNGLLVPQGDVTAWTAAMVRLATDPGLLERLRQGIGQVRTMSDVARDMAELYRELMETDRYAA
jgi:glycosyltransferase involved in cell wall biosynthesis